MQKNKISKYIVSITVLLFFIIALFFFLIKIRIYNADNYFMFAHARKIFSEGFTDTEPLTLHEGLSFMYPQWLFAVIIYSLKTGLGDAAVPFFMSCVFFLTFFILFKTGELICNNKKTAFIISLIIFSLYIFNFAYVRPYIITVCFILAEIYCIELYIRGSKKSLFLIPVISILLINFHNSLWISLFLIFLCYVGEWIVSRLLKETKPFNIRPLLFSVLLSFLAGFLNPYGPRYITYIFASLSVIKNSPVPVEELLPPTLFSLPSFFIILFLDIILILKNLNRARLRFFFMFFGFSFMTLLYLRNFIFFIIPGQLILFSCSKTENYCRWLPSSVFSLLSLSMVFLLLMPSGIKPLAYPSYDILDCFSQVRQEGTLFSDINPGSYAEYLGYRPYFDTRFEVFGIDNNKKKDIISEMNIMMTTNDKEKIEKFLDEYQFDYILLDMERNADFINFAADNGYSLIIGKQGYGIYVKEGLNDV